MTPLTHPTTSLLLLRAIDRHLAWAYEYAAVGDYDAAMEALEDAYAVALEIDCPVAA